MTNSLTEPQRDFCLPYRLILFLPRDSRIEYTLQIHLARTADQPESARDIPTTIQTLYKVHHIDIMAVVEALKLLNKANTDNEKISALLLVSL